jgi:NAD(P)-dependent dehydrogenase (short-subunit alcohol dehydrogenase family)
LAAKRQEVKKGGNVMKLENKVAVVTGGASGIGRAIAERFAAEGGRVIVADVDAAAVLRVADGLGPDALGIGLDVADPAGVEAMAERVVSIYGRIDVLINSAGIGRDIPFLDTPVEVLDRIYAINLKGSFLCGQSAARRMIRAGTGGVIINIASVSGLCGNIGRSAYGASKGAVITLTQVMAVELAEHGIRVNAIAPGPVETPLVSAMHTAEARSKWLASVPQRRYGEPAEIAAGALYLASSEAGYVTGHILAVDGGFMAAGLIDRG